MIPPDELENGAKQSLVPAARCTATNGQSETTMSLAPAISDTRPASVLASVTVVQREAVPAVERMAADDVGHPLDSAELQDAQAHRRRRRFGARRPETQVSAAAAITVRRVTAFVSCRGTFVPPGRYLSGVARWKCKSLPAEVRLCGWRLPNRNVATLVYYGAASMFRQAGPIRPIRMQQT